MSASSVAAVNAPTDDTDNMSSSWLNEAQYLLIMANITFLVLYRLYVARKYDGAWVKKSARRESTASVVWVVWSCGLMFNTYAMYVYLADPAGDRSIFRSMFDSLSKSLVGKSFLDLCPSLFLKLYHAEQWNEPESDTNGGALLLYLMSRWLGVALLTLGNVLLVWVHTTMKFSWQPFISLRAKHELVTTGPFRIVRHPMYFCVVLYAVGMLGATCSTFVSVPWFFILGGVAYRMNQEEDLLESHFGDDYRRFKRSTPYQLIPGVW
jgi:protein-S-isoprenylcysteine O-methyltransferase Ste14